MQDLCNSTLEPIKGGRRCCERRLREKCGIIAAKDHCEGQGGPRRAVAFAGKIRADKEKGGAE